MHSIFPRWFFCLLLFPLTAQVTLGDNLAKWALQLKMPDLISSSPVWDGSAGSAALQRRVSTSTAVRVGVDLILLSKETKPWFVSHGLQLAEVPTPIREVSLNANLLWYAPPIGTGRLYLGGGPLISTGREAGERWWYQSIRTIRSWGMEGVAGIAVALTPRASLFAEYKIRYTRRYYRDERQVDYGPDLVLTFDSSEEKWEAVPRSAIPLVGVSFSFK